MDDNSSPEVGWEDEEPVFGDWLKDEMGKQNVSIAELVARSGITYAGVWNIVNKKTKSPRAETRAKLADALNIVVPAEVEQQVAKEATSISGLTWTDFTPSDLQTIPQSGGIYVFYDVTDRPVYVGMSKANVRYRVKDHQTRFWFKEPLVVRGAFLEVADAELCLKIETILIKFLGKHALLNVKGATKDFD